MKYVMPAFYNINTNDLVPTEEFVDFYKKNFNLDSIKIYKFLLSLAYNGATNLEIEFDYKDDPRKFSLFFQNEESDVELLFHFYKNENNEMKIEFSTFDMQFDIDEVQQKLNLVKEASKFL